MATTFKLGLISVAVLQLFPHNMAHPRFEIKQPLVATTPSVTDERSIELSRGVTVQHVTNYSISFVPLVKLILNMIPKLINSMTQMQPNKTKQAKEMKNSPVEFAGSNPCLDSILTTKQYPGSSCHFYQCVLHQPASIKCLLQVIEDKSIGETRKSSKMKVEMSSFITSIQISECLSIRIHKCLPGHQYSSQFNYCVKNTNNFNNRNVCGT